MRTISKKDGGLVRGFGAGGTKGAGVVSMSRRTSGDHPEPSARGSGRPCGRTRRDGRVLRRRLRPVAASTAFGGPPPRFALSHPSRRGGSSVAAGRSGSVNPATPSDIVLRSGLERERLDGAAVRDLDPPLRSGGGLPT